MTSTTDSESTIHHSSQAADATTNARWSLCLVHHPDPGCIGRSVLLPPSEQLALGRRFPGFGEGVLHDGRVSRDHATIRVHRDGAVELEDEGSHNGTYVNGARVKGAALLAHGDVLRMGSILLLLGYGTTQATRTEHGTILGLSGPWGQVVEQIAALAATNTPVAICGETGVGKALVAQAIHDAGDRSGPCIRVPCATIPDRLVATELFGHEKGAYPGAEQPHDGYVMRAAGGTVLLQGLEDASTKFQGTLLAFLDDGIARRLGCDEPPTVDARVLVTLSAEPDHSGLRPELASRLAAHTIDIPPLRARPEDVALLATHFATQYAGRPVTLHWRTALKLIRYEWPGNVRQLQQVMKHLVDAAPDAGADAPLRLGEATEKLLRPRQAAAALGPTPEPTPDADAGVALPPRRLSKKKLQELLREHEGNVTTIANQLGIGRNTLYRWLKVAGLDQADYRGS